MNEALLYRASLFVLGCIFAFLGLSGLASGSVAVMTIVFSICGVGMIVVLVYEAFVSDASSRSSPEGWRLWLFVGLTALALVSFVWSALS